MEYGAMVAICCLIGMILLVLVGVPIFFSLLASAFAGFWLIGGITFALTQFTNGPYQIASNYSFAVVPLFILMGVLAGDSGIGDDAYDTMFKWFGGIRGGLAITTILAAALFGACSGSNLANAAVFTKIGLPELEKYKYDKRLSMGCIASAAGLDALIPPSIMVVIVCLLVNLSIGKLLIAGIIPGIVLAIGLIIGVMVIATIYPKFAPKVSVRTSGKKGFYRCARSRP